MKPARKSNGRFSKGPGTKSQKKTRLEQLAAARLKPRPLAPGRDAKLPVATLQEFLPEMDGSVPQKPQIRNRAEIRASVQHAFDTLVCGILDEGLSRIQRNLKLDPKAPLDLKTLTAVQGVGSLYAQVGIGYVGTNQLDPADIPNLPPPIFQTLDPNAPLPDGRVDGKSEI